MNKSELVVIRGYRPEDKHFIYASWLRGLYHGATTYSDVKKQVFMENYHKILEFILQRPTTEIKVACLKEDQDVILGYSVLGKDCLHWVFCKKAFRGIGIGRDLVPAHINTVTHMTKTGTSIVKKKGWEFNPFL